MKHFIAILSICLAFSVLGYPGSINGAAGSGLEAELTDESADLEALLERLRERGAVRVIVRYDMEYTRESSLSEEEAAAQRERIQKMHEKLVAAMEAKGLDFHVNRKLRISRLISVTVNEEEALKHLYRRSPLVEDISLSKPERPHLSESLSIVGADNVHDNLGFTASNQTIAILDTGVDYQHEHFSGNVVDGACFSTNDPGENASSLCPDGTEEEYGLDAGDDCDTTVSGCGHGTHVAGVAAGPGPSLSGVAKNAEIISAQVFSRIDSDGVCIEYANAFAPCALTFPEDQIGALEWIYDIRNQYDIAAVSMSLGGGQYSSPCDTDNRKPRIDDLKAAGISTVAASGNEEWDDATTAPACISSVIAVGATDKNDEHSNFSNAASFIDLVAPGENINSPSPGNNYDPVDGTSFATPHVTGTIALMRAADPTLTPAEIRSILHDTARNVPGMGGSNFTDEYGYGRLDAYRAVFEIIRPDPPTGLEVVNEGQVGKPVELSWTTSPTPGVDYEVHRCESHYQPCWKNEQVIGVTSSSSYTDHVIHIRDESDADGRYRYRVRAEDSDGYTSYFSNSAFSWGELIFKAETRGEEERLPTKVALEANRPNPVSSRTTIPVALPEPATVRVTVYDAMGREVDQVAAGPMKAGFHDLTWAPRNLSSGTYFYRLTVDGELVDTRQLTVVR